MSLNLTLTFDLVPRMQHRVAIGQVRFQQPCCCIDLGPTQTLRKTIADEVDVKGAGLASDFTVGAAPLSWDAFVLRLRILLLLEIAATTVLK